MNLERLSDERLLAVDRAPDAGRAFEEFYRRTESLVVAFCVRRVSGADVAADLVADTYLEALRCRHRFQDRGDGSAVAWLLGIAAHALGRHSRRMRAAAEFRPMIPRIDLDDDQAALLEAAGSSAAVSTALERLPAGQREAIRAYVLEGESYDEIAMRLGCEPQTVRKRVSRGLAVLRANYQEER